VGDTLSSSLLKEWLKDADILVNATSVGMHPNSDQTLVKREWLRPYMALKCLFIKEQLPLKSGVAAQPQWKL